MDKEIVSFRQLFRPSCGPTPKWSSQGCCDDAEEALAATLAIDHLLLHLLKQHHESFLEGVYIFIGNFSVFYEVIY
jgi:hypothetical protein